MGEIVSSIANIDLKNILRELQRGCIYFIFKERERVNDIHIFTVKDGEIVSNIYTDGELWNVCGDTEMAYEIIQDIDKKVILYLVEGERVVGQLFISRDAIRIEGDTGEIDKVLGKNRKIFKICCREVFLNTHYIRYLRPGDKDFERYLEEGRYYLLHINLSILSISRNGYVIYRGREPIIAAYEDNYGILCGNIAYRKIRKLMERSISTIDIYECSEDFVKILLERYPEMKVNLEEEEDLLEEEEEDIPSREELLRELGLEEPDEDWIEKVLKEVYAPPFEEILHLKREIEKDVVKRCKEIKGVKDVKVSLDIAWEDGVYVIEGEVKIERKKLLGIPLGKVDRERIEREIDKVIKSHIPTEYSTRISITIL